MVSLAWPVILAELGWVLMGVVDLAFVGPLGPVATGAVSTGSTIFFAFMVLGTGTFYALDTFVAQSYGAGRIDECHRWLFAGLQLAIVLSVVLIGLGLATAYLLAHAGMHPEVLPVVQQYLRALLWSTPPLLLFTVVRRYLQATNAVRAIMVAAVVANLVNAGANWVLVYGHLGSPAFGAMGSAYATLVARVCLFLWLGGVILWRERQRPEGLHDVPFQIDGVRMWRLVRLGFPAAGQVGLEVGVFATAATLAGRISPVALAANQIALSIASFFFMVPSGLASAAAVRVGQAIGRGDPAGARLAGWTAIRIALGASLVIAFVFATLATPILLAFTRDATVVAVGTSVLLVWAFCQPFDGLQAVTTGALRGLGETRIPMWANLVGHWLIGLPVAYLLCFRQGWGVVGLWAGLSLSLTLIGMLLTGVWHRRVRTFV